MTREFIDVLKGEYRQLEKRLEELRAREESLRAELAERLRVVSEEVTAAEARQRHIQALLTLEGSPMVVSQPVTEAVTWRSAGSLADEACNVLQEAGREMHYREIVAALEAKGITVPGKDPANNLVAHIFNDRRLLRPRRGVYGLREWFPKGMKSVGARRKTNRQQRRRNIVKA